MTADCLGIIIEIIGQRIFTAPWRTFSAVFAFTTKQMADIFLPDWCVLFLIIFGFVVIFTIKIDKKKHVNTV